ncbi:MAG: glucokinase [Betaproteobacteria bacterium]|nr:glucokinase [Betaproteobacteria bacterium]
MIIAGDIGATKTLLQLVERGGGVARTVFQRRYADDAYAEFAGLLAAFLADARAGGAQAAPLEIAVLGIAAPVRGERVRLTNRAWVIDAQALSVAFGIERVVLVNDFAAAASGIALLAPSELLTLQEGDPEDQAPRVVLGAGSGLGVAYLVWASGGYQVLAGEGGHMAFAPATELQAELWSALHARDGFVCVERVVSGSGLVEIYDDLRSPAGAPRRAGIAATPSVR